MASLAVRTATGAGLAVAATALLWLDGLAPAGVVPLAAGGALAVLGAWELARMERLFDGRFAREVLVASVLSVAAAVLGRGYFLELSNHGPALALAAAYGCTVLLAGGTALALARSARGRAALLAMWVAAPLAFLFLLDAGWGVRGLIALVIVSKIGDVFGYYVGRQIGRTHPFPTISPNKTTAGCVASLVAGIVAGAALAHFGLPVEGGWLHGAWTGGLLNLAAQAGDLFESRIKRRAEVKDSSALAGASGGVLDVVDSLLFTVPVALCVWPLAFR